MKLHILVFVSSLMVQIASICVCSSVFAQSVQVGSVPIDHVTKSSPWDDQIVEAVHLVANGDASPDWSTSENDYKKALALFSQDQIAKHRLAMHYFMTGDNADALKYFEAEASWINGHLQGMTLEDVALYSYELEIDGQQIKALRIYDDAYAWAVSERYGIDHDMTILPAFGSLQPPDNPSDFESALLALAGKKSGELACPDDCIVGIGTDGKALSGDIEEKAKASGRVLYELGLAAQLMPSSPYPYFYLGKYYKHVPGHEADAAEALHKAWELGGAAMGKRVFDERKIGTDAFKNAFATRFAGITSSR